MSESSTIDFLNFIKNPTIEKHKKISEIELFNQIRLFSLIFVIFLSSIILIDYLSGSVFPMSNIVIFEYTPSRVDISLVQFFAGMLVFVAIEEVTMRHWIEKNFQDRKQSILISIIAVTLISNPWVKIPHLQVESSD